MPSIDERAKCDERRKALPGSRNGLRHILHLSFFRCLSLDLLLSEGVGPAPFMHCRLLVAFLTTFSVSFAWNKSMYVRRTESVFLFLFSFSGLMGVLRYVADSVSECVHRPRIGSHSQHTWYTLHS